MKNQTGKRKFVSMYKRKQFDKEFKNAAVQLAVSRGGPIRRVAEGLGIKENILSRWIREYRQNSDQAFPGNGRLKPNDEEIRLLRKDNAELKVEKAILKKSNGHFLKGAKMKYAFISQHTNCFEVEKMCRVLKVSRTTITAIGNVGHCSTKMRTRA
jgi:transposase-like protein